MKKHVLLGLLLPVLFSPPAARAAARHSGLSTPAQGPSGDELMRRGKQMEAAGKRSEASTLYQQAYQAYTSVDNSDGMIQALARKKAVESGPAPAPAAASRPAATPAAVSGAAPVAGKMVGGKPVGLFFMTRYIYAFHSLEKMTWYFAPNGQVYRDPKGFSAAELAALPANSRGTYQVVGPDLVVKYADGHTLKSKLELSGGAFNWDMGIFVGMGPFSSTRQLVGSFEGGNSVSSSSGTAIASSSLTFKPDGTFDRSGAASFQTTSDRSTVNTGTNSADAGRYALAGWTLTLRFNNGKTTTGLAYPIEKDSKTGQVTRFFFNGVAYKRQ